MSRETSFLFAMGIASLLVLLVVALHYEALRLLSDWLPRLKIQPRLRILVLIIGVFFAHTLEVWIFAFGYYGLSLIDGLGEFGGATTGHIFDYVYFSVVVYTSVGFGDINPFEHMRLIAGVEALTGLLMIGWSASFTYLMMERFWPEHRR